MNFTKSTNLHPSNREELAGLQARYYFPLLLQIYETAIEEHGLPDAVDHLNRIMREGESAVENLLEQRKSAGKIQSVDQARKSVAGNAFQSLVLCALASLQAAEFIPSHLVFTLKTLKNSRLGGSVIQVGAETIKPDVDLLIYSDSDDTAPTSIYSLKTSLRERAGQTHRWKVLLDIVTAENCRSIKEKYDLQYAGNQNFLMSMITTNFYDEIMRPQQRGLLRFFDYVYVTKSDDFQQPVNRFSTIAHDLVTIYDR